MSRLEFDKVIKQLEFAHEICEDCVFEGHACYGCDVFYDRRKNVHRLSILSHNELKGKYDNERK